MKKYIVLTALGLFLITPFVQGLSTKKFSKTSSTYANGDIIFQSSEYGQSRAVQLATHSKYSHVGMLFQVDGKWMVYEAVQPVKSTPLNEWIKYGDNKHYVIKRLKNAEEVLTDEVQNNMLDVSKSYLGKNYDIYFEWSDENMYCSELVWKVYKESAGIELAKLQRMEEFDFSHPVVRSIAKQRYGDEIPKDELVISPARIFDSELLETVYSHKTID